MITQIEIHLRNYRKGFHLISKEIVHQIGELPNFGILHLHLKHTSAGLTLNENADPTVRIDFETFMQKLVPEDDPAYTHILEGSDDMPAHLKSSIFGVELTIPISNNRLNLGIWQGIYLCEFRNHGGERTIIATVIS